MSSRQPRRVGSDQPLVLLAQVFLLSRLAMAVVGGIVMIRNRRTFTDIAANWDVQHFMEIARQGYKNPTDPAFFPGWPLVLGRVRDLGIPMDRGGMVISVALSIVAALALYRLAGPKLGPWAAGLWLIAPTAIFTVVPYTESLFCALAFWAWERAKARQWWTMGVLAALACTVRVSGLFLVGALAILILTRPREGKGAARRRPSMWPLLWLLLPLAALFLYADYQHTRTGDWVAWYHAQTSGWSRAMPANQPLWKTLLMAPITSFQGTLPGILPGAYADHPGWAWIIRGEVVSMFVGTMSTVVLLLRRRWAEASWIGVQVYAFCLSTWWMSVNRAVLLWFPLWILLAEFCAWKPRNSTGASVHRVVVAVGVVTSFVVSLIWATFFYLGMWAS